MRRTKDQKGITLVALIITIVVLLILAMVAINSIQKEQLVGQVENATKGYNGSVRNEHSELVGYEGTIGNTIYYKPEGREGKKVKYDSNNDGTDEDWIILTDRDGKVEIVSAQPMGSLELAQSVTATKDLDGDNDVDGADTAILSYNNAITTINNYCKSLVKATDNEGVRSIGGTDNTIIPYTSQNYDEWGSKIKVDVASGDMQYHLDLRKLSYLGIEITSEPYWIASRDVSFDNACIFSVRLGGSNLGSNSYRVIFGVNYLGEVLWWSDDRTTYAVRPVIINPEGI